MEVAQPLGVTIVVIYKVSRGVSGEFLPGRVPPRARSKCCFVVADSIAEHTGRPVIQMEAKG